MTRYLYAAVALREGPTQPARWGRHTFARPIVAAIEAPRKLDNLPGIWEPILHECCGEKRAYEVLGSYPLGVDEQVGHGSQHVSRY